jgi:hypothetical protein
MRVTGAVASILGLLALWVSPCEAESLEVRLVSIDPPSVSRGDVVAITIETTPYAVCGASVAASGSKLEPGASITLPSYPAFFGRWVAKFRTAPVPAYYTVTVNCALGDQKGQLITHFSAS